MNCKQWFSYLFFTPTHSATRDGRLVLIDMNDQKPHINGVLVKAWKHDQVCDRYHALIQMGTPELIQTAEYQSERGNVNDFRESLAERIGQSGWIRLAALDTLEELKEV